MNGEETTTIGQVAESQANISNQPAQVAEQPAQAVQQPEQTTVANNDWTWTSSWGAEQATQETPAQTSEPTTEDVLSQVENITNESKTLNDVVAEQEKGTIQKENEDALAEIVKEQTKDTPSTSQDVNAEATSSTEETDKLDEELKQWLEDIKDKKSAEDMAKKVYLAFQKERSMHQFDNEQNKQTIEVLKWMVKKLNEQVASSDNDPRYVKLDDEGYALYRLNEAYAKDKSETSRNNLKRYYVAKLATLVPNVSANKIMEMFNNQTLTSNTIGAAQPSSAPIAESKTPAPKPMWIPASRRWMY